MFLPWQLRQNQRMQLREREEKAINRKRGRARVRFTRARRENRFVCADDPVVLLVLSSVGSRRVRI
jgi:hypothetical protein